MSRTRPSYLVRVTVHEPEDPAAFTPTADQPELLELLELTNDQLAEIVRVGVELATSCPTTVTSERLDR